MKKKTRSLAVSGVVAALYAVTTIVIAPFGFGAVQCRISDVMLIFCMKRKEMIAGCVVGCIIANMFSPLGPIDMAVGALVNFLIGYVAYKSKNMIITIISGGITAGIFVGTELWAVYSLPIQITSATVAAGEMISLALGAIIYKAIEKRWGTDENVK